MTEARGDRGSSFDTTQSEIIAQTPGGKTLGETTRLHGITGNTAGGKYFARKNSSTQALFVVSSPLQVSTGTDSQISTNNLQVIEHPSGLLVPEIQKPSSLNESPEGEILIIHEQMIASTLPDKQKRGIIMPTDNELIAYAAPEQREVPQRTSTELAIALHSPQVFLAGEVEKQLLEKETMQVKEVVQNLRTQGKVRIIPPPHFKYEKGMDHFDNQVLKRQVIIGTYTNRLTGEREKVIRTEPGALEKVGLAAISTLQDPTIKDDAAIIVFKPLTKLIKEYRVYSQFASDNLLVF